MKKILELHVFSRLSQESEELQLMRFTFSVDTLAIRSSGLIRSASMKRSFFPGSCVTGGKESEDEI